MSVRVEHPECGALRSPAHGASTREAEVPMCYMLLLSTDSPEDLSANNDSHIAFSRELPGLPEVKMLTYPHKWFVGSRHGCSCNRRWQVRGCTHD
jgi:hypothetical protein